jgi:hypothetical protein
MIGVLFAGEGIAGVVGVGMIAGEGIAGVVGVGMIAGEGIAGVVGVGMIAGEGIAGVVGVGMIGVVDVRISALAVESILSVGAVSETEDAGLTLPRDIKSDPQASQYSAPSGLCSYLQTGQDLDMVISLGW